MSIRFSAARSETNPAIMRVLCPVAPLDAANDNLRDRRRRPDWPAARVDPSNLPDALKHFARHGLSAALQARLKAEAARAEGDEVACARWLGICRQFDRRMADATARAFEGPHRP